MKELKAKMYGQKIKPNITEKTEDSKITVSKDIVLIESRGQKQAVPSMIAFTKLRDNYVNLKSVHNKTAKELNVLRESVKVMITAINEMNEELKNKIDKPD